MHIWIVGSWHQASVLSACFADMGHDVTGVSGTPAEASELNLGRAPVHEPGLDELLKKGLNVHRLRFTTWADLRADQPDFVFLAIDTPVGAKDRSDLSPITEAVNALANRVPGKYVLCVTSQVPVGTCASIRAVINAGRAEPAIPVVYVPEFLRLGSALETFRQADRFVIGADDPGVARRVASLYEPLKRPIYSTTVVSAEMAKHASNAFLATSISFINEISNLCEETGADVTEVTRILKMDRRIGPHAFLDAGLGYAGGTLGREVQALRELGKRKHVETDLMNSVDIVNSRRVTRTMQRLKSAQASLNGLKIAVWGLTYKPGTSTLRRSAALELIDLLRADGAVVAAFDPLARLGELVEKPPFELSGQPLDAAEDASALLLMGSWPWLLTLDFRLVAERMKRPLMLDTGNMMSPAEMVAAGFEYFGVGR